MVQWKKTCWLSAIKNDNFVFSHSAIGTTKYENIQNREETILGEKSSQSEATKPHKLHEVEQKGT
jgi:hypothetical protein